MKLLLTFMASTALAADRVPSGSCVVREIDQPVPYVWLVKPNGMRNWIRYPTAGCYDKAHFLTNEALWAHAKDDSGANGPYTLNGAESNAACLQPACRDKTACEYTSCTYQAVGDGLFRTNIMSKGGPDNHFAENFQCGANEDGTDCVCECDSSYKCTLNHLDSVGDTKSVHHCDGGGSSDGGGSDPIPENPIAAMVNQFKALSPAKIGVMWAACTEDTKDEDVQALGLYGLRFNAAGELYSFYLNVGGIYGPLPAKIFQFQPHLKEITIASSGLTGPIPTFEENPLLENLDLARNSLTGQIPQFPGENFKRIQLSYNQLSGTVPPVNSNAFQKYLVAGNALTGTLPSFANLPRFLTIQGEDNQLTGPIPSFPDSTLLQEVYLQNNELTGTIPAGLSDKAGMMMLNFMNNELTGTIPSYENSPNLRYLKFNGNNLSGTVPSMANCNCPRFYNIDVSNNPLLTGLTLWKNTPSNFATTALTDANIKI